MSNIVVPELGESVVEARVARWLKKEGDRVELGEPVVELETEKIDLEVNADRSGVIASIKRQEGEDVKIGELLAILEERPAGVPGGQDESGAAAGAAAAKSGNGSSEKSAPSPAVVQPAAAAAEEPRSTPTARSIAKAHDVNIGAVQGSGTAGRVMKQDVQAALGGAKAAASDAKPAPVASRPTSAPTRPAPRPPTGDRTETRQRMSKRRATIARRLVEAQRTAAMLTTF